PQARLQILRRENRIHRFQRCEDAAAVHPGARKDSAAPHLRNLRAASAQAAERNQTRAHRRAASIRDGLMTETSLHTEPAAITGPSFGRSARHVTGYSILIAVMLVSPLSVF